ncbi:MAG TPA: response regulator [Thermomicrobiales bacterium]|jgi:CheY-like chemotaxis protein|nr:response regulator [Thermomicrobiales bacterium]
MSQPLPIDRPVVGIIEDQQAIAQMLVEVLGANRFQPVFLEPPYSIDAITAVRPGVLLLDIMLNQASGWDILEQLREDPAGRDLPIIITSAVYDRPGLRSLPPGGPVVFIPKPFEILTLLAGIRDLLDPKGAVAPG